MGPVDEEKTSSERLGGFLISVFSAAQNWNDNTNSRMPAVRDRVTRVPLGKDEGGFNLNMPADVQESVAKRGQEAAAMLIERFCPAADGSPGAGWDQQRWERFDVLLRTLSKRMPSVELALRDTLARYVVLRIARVSGHDHGHAGTSQGAHARGSRRHQQPDHVDA